METITLKQIPIISVIQDKLEVLSNEIDKKINLANSLLCNEETIKDVKKTRTEIKKYFERFETQRKSIKTAVLEPYNKFESIYKEQIANKFNKADSILKDKISSVESELKNNKREEIKAYFNEYAEYKNIDFIEFEASRINVSLSASVKSLKEQAKVFIDKISNDVELIKTHEFSTEIFIEYKNSLDVTTAFKSVLNRKEELQKIQLKKNEEQEEKPLFKLEPPKEIEAKRTLTFKVTASIQELKELKKFLDRGNYEYE